MNRRMHHAMISQYALQEASGDGRVEFDQAVKSYTDVTLYGKCEQDGTPTPESPVPVRYNDGQFVGRGQNLFEMKSYIVGRVSIFEERTEVIHVAGEEGSGENAYSSGQIQFQFATLPKSQYLVSIPVKLLSVGKYGNKTALLVGTPNNYAEYSFAAKKVAENARTVISVAVHATTQIASVTMRLNNCEWDIYIDQIQIKLGDTATPYTPYHDGGTAQAPELYGIGDVRDEWDPLTGRGVRRCAVIKSYAGEAISTPYISSTGELSEGATVVYVIPDTPFETTPAPLSNPTGYAQIIQLDGSVADCPIKAKYLTHS